MIATLPSELDELRRKIAEGHDDIVHNHESDRTERRPVIRRRVQ